MKRIGVLFLVAASLEAAPVSHDHLEHVVNNHESEIRMLEDKCNSQQEMLANLEKRLKENQQRQSTSHLEGNVARLTQDVQKLQDYATEVTKALAKLQKELSDERANNEHLQGALTAVLEALEMPQSGKTYQVRAGDSLGKIASDHHTSIREIKRLNQLSNDRINVGQELKLPS